MSSSIDVAIIGAGPYGLSLASHLAAQRIDFRIFGKTMEYWKANMPAGMLLKSYPWASNLSEPRSQFTVKKFFADRDMPYHDTLKALSLETFVAYGEAFQRQLVPNVEPKMLALLEQIPQGFRATFDDGEVVNARRVVLAIGLHAFKHVPDALAELPMDSLSHAGDYGQLNTLRGKQVVVLGSGASASDLAALLHEQGVSVSMLARGDVQFASAPRRPTLLERIVDPSCGIGSGWVLKACADAPRLIHKLPPSYRLRLAKVPGPLGGAFMKDRVIGRVPVFAGREIEGVDHRAGRVHLRLVTRRGGKEVLEADHVVAATGYKIDVSRLSFVDARLRPRIQCLEGAPVLTTRYETSLPGLHVIGPASAASLGPVGRFVFGTKHSSRQLARHLSQALVRRPASATKSSSVVSPVPR